MSTNAKNTLGLEHKIRIAISGIKNWDERERVKLKLRLHPHLINKAVRDRLYNLWLASAANGEVKAGKRAVSRRQLNLRSFR
jgi:hypothetical protein